MATFTATPKTNKDRFSDNNKSDEQLVDLIHNAELFTIINVNDKNYTYQQGINSNNTFSIFEKKILGVL